jgi:hypothetical protein
MDENQEERTKDKIFLLDRLSRILQGTENVEQKEETK